MKINNNDINMNKIMKAYQNIKQKNSKKNIENKRKNTDQIDISKEAKQIKKIEQALQKKDEVRSEKVSEIKEQLDKKTYEIDTQKIAEKIVSETEDEV